MATTLVSLNEYLHTNYDPDMEYVDGVLVERNVGDQSHGLLQAIVASYLGQFRKSHRLSVFIACRLFTSTGRYRIPDLMVLEQPYSKGTVVTDVPAAVIEIKSPDDTLDEVMDKCLEYSALGIPNIVVLDPDHKRQYAFQNRGLQLVSILSLELPKSGASLPFPAAELFAELDS
jgi:Uma2 family endonuclease